MRKTQITLAVSVMMLFLGMAMISCGSAVPGWYRTPPEAEDAIYGVGMAAKQNPTLARQTAIARARQDVAGQVSVRVSSMLKDFMQESGVGENAQALEFTQSVTKQVTDVALKGAKVKEVRITDDGTMYALVEYPLAALGEAALSEAQRQEALYNEFKAQQGFEALEKALRNMK
ncbi:MAG TPA: LPP20 family lipoprotein [bacterium]|nr:LPP20 family lipoprotein [bacterium]